MTDPFEQELKIIREQPTKRFVPVYPQNAIHEAGLLATHYNGWTWMILHDLDEPVVYWDTRSECWMPLNATMFARRCQHIRNMSDVCRIASDTNQAIYHPKLGWRPV